MNYSILADAAAASADSKRSTLAVTPTMRVDKKTVYLNGVRGSTGPEQTVTLTNTSSAAFKLTDASFLFSGAAADRFQIIRGRTNRTLQAGAKSTYAIVFKPGAGESLADVLTATLSIKAKGASRASAAVSLRAIATAGTGGNNEPSLARIMDLYGYTINVGDTDPSTTTLDLDGSATDQTYAPRFQKAGGDAVTIKPIATFVSDAAEPGRIGYYAVGHADQLQELYHYDAAFAQAVSPTPDGPTTFDPGSTPFGVYAQIPVFRNADGTARTIYSEDALNTWEPNAANRGKVRVYPLSVGGKVVDNSFVVTFEDYTVNDQNDYVYVISGVNRLKSMATSELVPQGGQPVADRLVFSNVGTPNTTYPNYTTKAASVQIVNTGNQDLVIDSVSLTSGTGSFQIVNAPTSPVTVTRGSTYTIDVKFIADTTDVKTGTLVVQSNDKYNGTRTISLAGYWQQYSEHGPNDNISVEPTLQDVFDLFGFQTKARYDGQSLNTNGAAIAVGDEVLSTYWERVDASLPVAVQHFAAYHQQRYSTEVAWYAKGHPWYASTDSRYTGTDPEAVRNTIFYTNNLDGQTVIPRLTNGSLPAVGTFAPTGAFGFRVDAELSDDALNTVKSGNAGGHHIRFYPLKDADGRVVANTYLMIMDAGAINFDFQDNQYIVRNVKPAGSVAQVTGLNGYANGRSVVLDWSGSTGATGYRVLRSDSANGTFTTIADNLFATNYTDPKVRDGKRWFYEVLAIDANGKTTLPIETSVRVPKL